MICIIFLIISFILIILNNNRSYEHYDERIADTDLNKCAEFCKTRAGCFGFGYDKKNKVCYPSKSLIEGKPIDPEILYLDEYKDSNVSCNKLEPILKPMKDVPFDNRRKNSVYVCREKVDLFPQWYLHSDSEFENLGEGKNIDYVFDVDEYSVMQYKWPNNKYSIEQKKLLKDFRDDQELTPNKISNISKINKTSNSQNIQNIQNIADDNNKKWNNNYVVYKINNNYNTGDYLKSYKCMKNISLDSCLKYCSGENDCTGVEFNPLLYGENNICCPKKNIKRFVKRNKHMCKGKFYKKQVLNLDNFDHSKTYITF